jgi:hypothetical protein
VKQPLNDFNLPDPLSGGSILNATFTPGQLSVAKGKVTVNPKDYRKALAIDLSLVIPLGGPKPSAYTCP